MILQSIYRSAAGLGLFALLTAGIIALTQQGTDDLIKHNVREARTQALYQLIPSDSHNNDILQDTFPVTDPDVVAGRGELEGYIARLDGEVIGVIIPTVAPDGYTGAIDSIVGIDARGIITGGNIGFAFGGVDDEGVNSNVMTGVELNGRWKPCSTHADDAVATDMFQ